MLLTPIVVLLVLADPATEEIAPLEPVTQPPAPVTASEPPPQTTAAAPTPPASAEAIEDPDPPSPPPAPVRPATTFGLEFGYARGGDRFLTIIGPTPAATARSSANAGDGGFVSLAGSWTPYWSKRGVGLGVYARIGAKYVGVGDGMTAMSFLRVPLGAGAQLLLPVVGRWFAVGRLGLMTEVLGQITVRNGPTYYTSTDLSPRLGEFLDVGVRWAATEYSGLAVIARYERLDVSYAGAVTSANNLGAIAAANLGF